MGGGFPAAAFGGRADVMARLAPAAPSTRRARCRGTRSRRRQDSRRCATRGRRYARVDAVAAQLGALVSPRWPRPGRPPLQHAGSMFSVFFCDGPVVDYDAAKGQDAFRFKAFFHSMLSQGVYLPPSAFESWFVSAAHDDAAIARIADALPAAARARRGTAEGPHEPDSGATGDDHRRPPAAPRRGAQPAGRALRTAARLPPLGPRPGDGRAGRRAPGRCATSPTSSPRRWSGRRRRPPRRPRPWGSRSPSTSG